MPCFGNAALKNTSMVGMWKMSVELKNSKPILGCKALWQFLPSIFWTNLLLNKALGSQKMNCLPAYLNLDHESINWYDIMQSILLKFCFWFSPTLHKVGPLCKISCPIWTRDTKTDQIYKHNFWTIIDTDCHSVKWLLRGGQFCSNSAFGSRPLYAK